MIATKVDENCWFSARISQKIMPDHHLTCSSQLCIYLCLPLTQYRSNARYTLYSNWFMTFIDVQTSLLNVKQLFFLLFSFPSHHKNYLFVYCVSSDSLEMFTTHFINQKIYSIFLSNRLIIYVVSSLDDSRGKDLQTRSDAVWN